MTDETRCENMATVKRYWPGREPDTVCVVHAQQSQTIADAMGFHLALEPIGYPADQPLEDMPKCCCKMEGGDAE